MEVLFDSQISDRYQLLWDSVLAGESQVSEDLSWQLPLNLYFQNHPQVSLPHAEWNAQRSEALGSVARKYQASGNAFLSSLDDTSLTSLFVSTTPKSFRMLISEHGASADGSGPFLFPVKTCLSLWNDLQTLALSEEEQFAFMQDVYADWEDLEDIFDEFRDVELEPLRGEDFWRTMIFQAHVSAKFFDITDDDVAASAAIRMIIKEELKSKLFVQQEFAKDTEFQNIFVASRNAADAGLPKGITIAYEIKIALYAVWSKLDVKPSPDEIRQRFKTVRHVIQEFITLDLWSEGPDTEKYKNEVFQNLLINLIQGGESVYQEFMKKYQATLKLGRSWYDAKNDFEPVQNSYTQKLKSLQNTDKQLLKLSAWTLTESQNLPSWYNPLSWSNPFSASEAGAYDSANISAEVLRLSLEERNSFLKEVQSDKVQYQKNLRDLFEKRLMTLRSLPQGDVLVQMELYNVYSGNMTGFESENLVELNEVFSVEYLLQQGLDLETFNRGDSVSQAIQNQDWSTAWSNLRSLTHQDFFTCRPTGVFSRSIQNQDWITDWSNLRSLTHPVSYPTVVEESKTTTTITGKGSMLRASKEELPKPGTITPDGKRLSYRLTQLTQLMQHDPDFVAFSDFMLEAQPLINVMNALLTGARYNGDALLGFFDPSMNRPEAAVDLLKGMAQQFQEKYSYSSNPEYCESMQRALVKLSQFFDVVNPEIMNLPPKEAQLLSSYKSIVDFLAPEKNGDPSRFSRFVSAVASPGFDSYSFKRAAMIYGPDIAGAVAGAIVIGALTGGSGSAAIGASWFVRGVRMAATMVRTSAIVSAGAVVGKEIARSGMDALRVTGVVNDYGIRPLAADYASGKLSGDEAFVAIFGELGRELFDILGFERSDSDLGLQKLFQDYDEGKVDVQGFVFRLLGEYGFQVVSMAGVSMAGKALGSLAGRMILSGDVLLVGVGRTIEKFAGLFESLTDKVVLGTVGEMQAMSGFEIAKTFFSELAEESIENAVGQLSGSPGLEWLVSILGASRTTLPDYAGSTLFAFETRADGAVVSDLHYTRGLESQLLTRLQALNEHDASIVNDGHGTIVHQFQDAHGKKFIQKYTPSDVPATLRQALMTHTMQMDPEVLLAEIGISGWKSNGQPIWKEGADISKAAEFLRRKGFIVENQSNALRVSWLNGGLDSSLSSVMIAGGN